MRIRTQVFAAALVAAMITALLAAGLFEVTRRSAAGLEQQAGSQEVARDVANLLTLTNEFAFYASERSATQWKLRHGQLVATVERAIEREQPPLPALLEVRRGIDDLPSLFERLVQLSREPASPLFQRRKELLIERLLAETQEVVEARHRWALAIGEEQRLDQRIFTALVLAAPAVLLVLLLALGSMVARRVLMPLARLETAVTAMRGGDLDVRCGSTAQDELGDAARAVDAMAMALQQRSAALRESENHLRLVNDNVPVLIGYIDHERRSTLVNQATLDWHGRPASEIIGARVADLYEPPTFAQLAPHLERAFAGERVEVELDLEHAGTLRSMLIVYVPQLDEQGQVRGVYTMQSDITRRQRVERQLRTMMESSPLGMFHADPQGRCVYANPAWLRIAGRTLEESLDWGWNQAVHPEDRTALVDLVRAGRESGQVHVTEHRYLRPDGSIVWVRGHGVALREGERTVGIVGTVEDITERRQLDASLTARTDELARSNAELEQFAYVASHDLQEPLRMVTSYSQLLLRRHADKLDGDAKEFLAFIDDGGRRAQALILDLLSLARVNSQAKPFEPVPVREVVDEVLRALALKVRETGAVVTFDEPLPVVSADRRQLNQLLQNLVANALTFRGSAAPRVHVGARREPDGRWRLQVADNGIGIAPKFHERVFVIFQRLHLRNEYPGTGIGLAICKKVVERHGGRIGVESVPGEGSTFWFTLADGGDVPAPTATLLHDGATETTATAGGAR